MLTELVELIVGPYRQYPDSISVDCGGSFVWPELVRVLGMTLHELATNAVKYGALSSRQGRVAISSRSDDGGGSRLLICWAEHDGPPIGAKGRPGFGMPHQRGARLRDRRQRHHPALPRSRPALRHRHPAPALPVTALTRAGTPSRDDYADARYVMPSARTVSKIDQRPATCSCRPDYGR